jgi:hypothetical protein
MNLIPLPEEIIKAFETNKKTHEGEILNMKIKKLPAHYAAIALPFAISIFMSCIVSSIATWRGIGFVDHFFVTWMSSWAISWIVAFPVLLVILPIARRIVFTFVEEPGRTN